LKHPAHSVLALEKFPKNNLKHSEGSAMLNVQPNQKTVSVWFRGLLIAEVSLFMIAVPLSLISAFLFETAQEEIESSVELPVTHVLFVGLGCISLLIGLPALIISWVGLFLFKPWARWLYLGVQIGFRLLVLPFSLTDYSPTWGFITALTDFGSLITGSILAIVFLSPLAKEFLNTPASTDPASSGADRGSNTLPVPSNQMNFNELSQPEVVILASPGTSVNRMPSHDRGTQGTGTFIGFPRNLFFAFDILDLTKLTVSGWILLLGSFSLLLVPTVPIFALGDFLKERLFKGWPNISFRIACLPLLVAFMYLWQILFVKGSVTLERLNISISRQENLPHKGH
jgi:hypothetical protein